MVTVRQSVDELLSVFAKPQSIPPAILVRQLEELVAAPSADEPRVVAPGGPRS